MSRGGGVCVCGGGSAGGPGPGPGTSPWDGAPAARATPRPQPRLRAPASRRAVRPPPRPPGPRSPPGRPALRARRGLTAPIKRRLPRPRAQASSGGRGRGRRSSLKGPRSAAPPCGARGRAPGPPPAAADSPRPARSCSRPARMPRHSWGLCPQGELPWGVSYIWLPHPTFTAESVTTSLSPPACHSSSIRPLIGFVQHLETERPLRAPCYPKAVTISGDRVVPHTATGPVPWSNTPVGLKRFGRVAGQDCPGPPRPCADRHEVPQVENRA